MMDTPIRAKRIGISPYLIYSIGIFCFMSAQPILTHARPLARPQRQVLAGELATGLTGTGTSFNPLYEGQDVVDSYYGYQFDQQRTNLYDDISSTPYNNNWPRGGVRGGYKEAYGVKGGGGGYGYGFPNSRPDYGYGYGIGNEGTRWQGFGGGKIAPYGGQPASQYGLKY